MTPISPAIFTTSRKLPYPLTHSWSYKLLEHFDVYTKQKHEIANRPSLQFIRLGEEKNWTYPRLVSWISNDIRALQFSVWYIPTKFTIRHVTQVRSSEHRSVSQSCLACSLPPGQKKLTMTVSMKHSAFPDLGQILENVTSRTG